MILVTGGTGFIGRALVRQLVENGNSVRLLIKPSSKTPDLPRGVPIDVAISSLHDQKSLQIAMVGVDTIFHLASDEKRGVRGSLLSVDIQGTRSLCQAAIQSEVKRLFYVSHLGADRASAYPLLKAKAIAEEYIRRSGINYTILRAGVVFGQGDRFTNGLVRFARMLPFFYFVPGDGLTLLQPLWVEDLATCLVWGLEDVNLENQTIPIGGPEFLTLNQIIQIVLDKIKIRRRLIQTSLAYLNILTIIMENFLPSFPSTSHWIDYFATNRTCSLDTIPRLFHILPSRFSHRLDYLTVGKNKPFSKIAKLFKP